MEHTYISPNIMLLLHDRGNISRTCAICITAMPNPFTGFFADSCQAYGDVQWLQGKVASSSVAVLACFGARFWEWWYLGFLRGPNVCEPITKSYYSFYPVKGFQIITWDHVLLSLNQQTGNHCKPHRSKTLSARFPLQDGMLWETSCKCRSRQSARTSVSCCWTHGCWSG